VAEEFITRHVGKLRSCHDSEATIRRELISRWGERPITEISRRDVIALIEEIADSGRSATARKIFAHSTKLFGWAVARGVYGIETSPCSAVKTATLIGAPEARQRVLNDAEIRALWKASEGIGYPAGPFVRMLLLSGQRLRDCAEMTWSEVDLETGLWVIPPERMKGERAHEIPLPVAAIELLKSLHRWEGDFMFSTTGGVKSISSFSAIKLRVDAAITEPIAPWRDLDTQLAI
jgi:integrase